MPSRVRMKVAEEANAFISLMDMENILPTINRNVICPNINALEAEVEGEEDSNAVDAGAGAGAGAGADADADIQDAEQDPNKTRLSVLYPLLSILGLLPLSSTPHGTDKTKMFNLLTEVLLYW